MPPAHRRAPRIPPDVARVIADHADLGRAARKALHVSETVARKGVQDAARIAAALRKRERGR